MCCSTQPSKPVVLDMTFTASLPSEMLSVNRVCEIWLCVGEGNNIVIKQIVRLDSKCVWLECYGKLCACVV